AAVKNLQQEGYPFVVANGQQQRIEKVGDVMQDSAELFATRAAVPEGFKHADGFVLTTIHRAENTDHPERSTNIMAALNEGAQSSRVLLPINPGTPKSIAELQLKTANMTLTDQFGHMEMIWMLRQCGLVVTDSGGVHKKASFMGKACVTMRDQTEWVE